MNSTILQLQQRIEALEIENNLLRKRNLAGSGAATVLVPDEMKPLFSMAQQTVDSYFTNLNMQPHKGTIEINDQRYILVRASALSTDFLDTIQNLYADRGEAEAIAIGKNFLFDIAHTLGINDAKNFHAKMNLTEPIAKLSAGPVHFAYTGWAFVEIMPESNPSPDDNFYLIYNHPFSFEADSWIRSGKKSDTPVCIMNAGYSSGWCEQSFGIPLTAVEVSCMGRGDEQCTFIMSPPHRIKDHLKQFNLQAKNTIREQNSYDIPTFFERKKVEEEMQRSKLLAESSVKAKEDFISNMSHELRTPLGAVLGFTEQLNKTPLSSIQKEYVEAISSAGNNLLSIINDILDLSKIDAGKFDLDNTIFSIPELLHSVKVMFSEKAKTKNLGFSMEIDPSIHYLVSGDSMRLTQIIINLTGNALKFTEKGEVHVSCTEKNSSDANAEIHFSIKDTGIGIPGEKLAVIFERFTQADTNITRRYGGTGLGLAIAKQLVELLGGTIGVTSEWGSGSEFSFTLSFTKAAINTQAARKMASSIFIPSGHNAEILIVEDNAINQKLAATILANNNFKYRIAGNGAEAIELLKEQPADLILMDIQMPVMDGYEATCIIRDQLNIRVPIIAMTAHAMAGEKEKCIRQGFNDYLPKPFSEQDLLHKISSLLGYNQHKNEGNTVTDLSFLQKQTRNNETVINEMIRAFLSQVPIDLDALESAINQQDYTGIFKKAHALRNSLELFSRDAKISSQLLSIENIGRSGAGTGEAAKLFTEVKIFCNKALNELAI